MGLFDKIKAGLEKTHGKLVHEIKRIVTRSPRLTGESLEELEAALIGADLGMPMVTQIVDAVRKAYETQGSAGLDIFAIAQREVERNLSSTNTALRRAPNGPTVVSIVGVNGTGKTTTAAKLAGFVAGERKKALLAACDTFRAAAIEQLKLWGQRLNVDVIASTYGSDAAAVAHDAVVAAQSPEELEQWVGHTDPDVRAEAAVNPYLSYEQALRLVRDPDVMVRWQVARTGISGLSAIAAEDRPSRTAKITQSRRITLSPSRGSGCHALRSHSTLPQTIRPEKLREQRRNGAMHGALPFFARIGRALRHQVHPDALHHHPDHPRHQRRIAAPPGFRRQFLRKSL